MQQLEMFPEDTRIERVAHDANMYRFYRLRLIPDLFGGVSLLREWGRIGTGSTVSSMQAVQPMPWWRSIGRNKSGAISSRGDGLQSFRVQHCLAQDCVHT